MISLALTGEPAADSGSLQAELAQVEAELQDIRDLRHGFLGQTGVHIGYRVLRQVTHQLDSEEARLTERLQRIEGLLQAASSQGSVGRSR